jgi:hypothetical protein
VTSQKRSGNTIDSFSMIDLLSALNGRVQVQLASFIMEKNKRRK